jgi:hypothetical protein
MVEAEKLNIEVFVDLPFSTTPSRIPNELFQNAHCKGLRKKCFYQCNHNGVNV